MAELSSTDIDNDSSLTEEQKVALKDTTKIKAVLSGNVPVPIGYTYVEGTSTAQSTAGTNGWGVVIKDGSNNEWVWVPVNSTESIAPSEAFEEITENNILGKNEETKEEKTNSTIANEKIGPQIASISGISGLKVARTEGDPPINYEIRYFKNGEEVEEDTEDITYTGESDYAEITENDINKDKYEGYVYMHTINKNSNNDTIGTTLPASLSNGDYIELHYYSTDVYNALNTTAKYKSKNPFASNMWLNPYFPQYFKEPSLVDASEYYNIDENNYREAGYGSLTEMALDFYNDYDKCVESIYKYGGFYVGRYELGGTEQEPKVKKNENPIINKNWYQLYNLCKDFGNDIVGSSMIYNTEWDIMCIWTAEKGDQKRCDVDSLEHHGLTVRFNRLL